MSPTKNEKRYLVAFGTNAGSTAGIARAIGEELGRSGTVAVRRLEEVADVAGYDAAVIGGPMIVGWHRTAAAFVRRHRRDLGRIPVAYFAPALSLTAPDSPIAQRIPLFLDPALVRPPRRAGRMGIREWYASVDKYLNALRQAAPEIRPTSVAYFAGKLDLSVLGLFQRLFVLWIAGARPAEMRNWEAIREWAATLPARFARDAAEA